MRSGVGRAMWDHLAATARDLGGTQLHIESDPNAVEFYLAMGADDTGTLSKPVPPNRRLPVLVYALDETAPTATTFGQVK